MPLRRLIEAATGVAPSHAGQALRQGLLEALAAFRLSGPIEGARLWRWHQILYLRYVEGADPGAIQRQLALAKSQYYAEHARALEAFAAFVAERWRATNAGATADQSLAAVDSFPAPFSTVLPTPLTTFVGREREVRALGRLLTPSDGDPSSFLPRLITLIGPAGIGKTRLAMEVAAALARGTQGRICLVALDAAETPDSVAATIARALSLPDLGPRHLTEQLGRVLLGRPFLLLLDTFEHVLAAAPLVADLLAACPTMQVIVTSRARLQIYGEHVFPVPALALPDLNALPDTERLATIEVVRLFVDRARAALPDFALTDEHARAIAEICVRLEGLPLAIELAAARVAILGPQALLAWLERRLDVLTTGPRDLPARQRSLRAAIAWSYDILDASERTLFRRLAIFTGGFSLTAARAIAGDDVQLLSETNGAAPASAGNASVMLDGLEGLADKSLLVHVAGPDTEPRFDMLGTIREFALECLEACGEAATLRERHAAYYGARAREAEPELLGPRQVAWLDRLERDHDNLKAALRWHVSAGSAEQGLEVGSALGRFWMQRGHLREGRELLTRLLAMADDGTPSASAARANVLARAAGLAMDQGDLGAARALQERALALQRRLGDRLGTAVSLSSLGLAAREQGDLELARQLLEQSLAAHREAGDRRGEAMALDRLGTVAHVRGDPAAARTLYEESLSLFRELGQQPLVAWSLHNQGYLALDEGDLLAARSLFARSLGTRRELLDRSGIVRSITAVATLAVAGGQIDAGVRLAGAATSLEATVALSPSVLERDRLQRALETARRTIAAQAWAAAWSGGQALTMQQAVAEALDICVGPRRVPADGAPTA